MGIDQVAANAEALSRRLESQKSPGQINAGRPGESPLLTGLTTGAASEKQKAARATSEKLLGDMRNPTKTLDIYDRIDRGEKVGRVDSGMVDRL